MSKFSKHSEKPKWIPKEGALAVMTEPDGLLLELGEVHEIEGMKWVWIEDINFGNKWRIPVRVVIEELKNGNWRIVKDGPIEPEKILKEFKFI